MSANLKDIAATLAILSAGSLALTGRSTRTCHVCGKQVTTTKDTHAGFILDMHYTGSEKCKGAGWPPGGLARKEADDGRD